MMRESQFPSNQASEHVQEKVVQALFRYIDFYDCAPVGYLTLNNKGLITEVNLTAASLLGMERSRLLYQPLSRFVSPSNYDQWQRAMPDMFRHGNKQTCELELTREDESTFHAQLDCLRLLRETPVLRIVLSDITERKRLDKILREQEEFFRVIAENTDDFIAVLDLEGRRMYNSPSYAKLFGDPQRLKGTDSFAEIHPDDRERVRRLFMETVRSGIGLRADFRFVLNDGSIRYMESKGWLIGNARNHDSRVVVVSRDVTAQRQIEEEIRNLAFYDELTKQPNRRLLKDRLIQCMAASKRSGRYGALIFLDMDNFKPLNDTYGHSVGDLLLVEVARRINKCVREMDTVSRFGGDEFVVILSELDAEKAQSIVEAGIVTEKIRASLAEPYFLKVSQPDGGEHTIEHRCTSSIGVVVFVDHEYKAEDIIKWADLTMYQAKNGGRNMVRFFDANIPAGITE